MADYVDTCIAFILTWWRPAVAIITTIASAMGAFQAAKHLTRFIFRSKSVLVMENEALHELLAEKRNDIANLQVDNDKLDAELRAVRDCLPDAAIARAENEWRYNNQERASCELQKWFDTNAANIAKIAIGLAEFHISRAVPDPGDHLDTARNMLRLARAITPGNQEARDLESELDRVNAGLQEQLLLDGELQIAWYPEMVPRFGEQREQLLPAIRAIDAVAQYCDRKGLYRLASIFGDRAADIALTGGPSLRSTWFVMEQRAASYQIGNGQYLRAFNRLDSLIYEAGEILGPHHSDVLASRYLRAEILQHIGRVDEAMIEVGQLITIHAQIRGERHPQVFACRYLRVKALERLRRFEEALSEIDRLIPVQTEVLGQRDRDVLTSRNLRARLLGHLGRHGEALKEVDRSIRVEAEVLSRDHPDVLSAECLKADLLQHLRRNKESRAALNALEPRLNNRTDADGYRRRWVQRISAALDGRSAPPAAAE